MKIHNYLRKLPVRLWAIPISTLAAIPIYYAENNGQISTTLRFPMYILALNFGPLMVGWISIFRVGKAMGINPAIYLGAVFDFYVYESPNIIQIVGFTSLLVFYLNNDGATSVVTVFIWVLLSMYLSRKWRDYLPEHEKYMYEVRAKYIAQHGEEARKYVWLPDIFNFALMDILAISTIAFVVDALKHTRLLM